MKTNAVLTRRPPPFDVAIKLAIAARKIIRPFPTSSEICCGKHKTIPLKVKKVALDIRRSGKSFGIWSLNCYTRGAVLQYSTGT